MAEEDGERERLMGREMKDGDRERLLQSGGRVTSYGGTRNVTPVTSYGGTRNGSDVTPGQIEVDRPHPDKFSLYKLWQFSGPGFLMSIAYLDPGNIESDLQSGALAGYKLLWVLMWSTVMGLVLQLLAAKLGCVTGMNLAEVCYQEYPRLPRLVLWLMVEVAIIGSDIQEVIGSAVAINLLSNQIVPIWAGVLITGVDTFTFLLLENAGLRKLEALFGALITTMAAAFLYMYITIAPNQGEILIGLWFPWCEGCGKDAIQQLVGIVGAVVMPHNIYLHSALVLSRIVDRKNRDSVREAKKYYSIESAIALTVSFLINLFVVATFAAAFSEPKYADNASIRNAGEWLYEKYGTPMKVIWAIGILAAGQSSTMTGTYAGQFVMQGFLNIEWAKWKRVLVTRSIAIVPTIIVAVLATSNLDDLNSWLNVLQSVQLPFALLPILHFTSTHSIMGQFTNGRIMKVAVWLMGAMIMGINAYLVYLFLGDKQPWFVYTLTACLSFVYLLFVIYLALGVERFSLLKEYVRKKLKFNTRAIENTVQCENHSKYPTTDVDIRPLQHHSQTSSDV